MLGNVNDIYDSIQVIIKLICNEHPFKPHFIVKLGFTGVLLLFFLYLLKNIDRGYSLEPPQ